VKRQACEGEPRHRQDPVKKSSIQHEKEENVCRREDLRIVKNRSEEDG